MFQIFVGASRFSSRMPSHVESRKRRDGTTLFLIESAMGMLYYDDIDINDCDSDPR